MISKEQLAAVTEVLATASVVGVGLALGGPVGATVMAGIGINLGSNIIQSGSTHLKEKWISAKYGVLNHDIQRALARAFVKALIRLEARYFELPEANAQPTEKKEAIRGLFKELKDEAPTVFVASVESIVSGQELKQYLYGEPEIGRTRLWERVEGTKLLYSYYGDHFKEFLRESVNDELVFWFGEELKTDNRECNKAWRAFQRMLLEGIQADVKAVQASQELIRQDLQALDGIRTRVDELKGAIDRRTSNEPFQQGLEEAIRDLKQTLESVAATTQRTETKVDVVIETTERTEAKIDTVVAALRPTPIPDIPKIPDEIKTLVDQGNTLRDEGSYEEARVVFNQALDSANAQGHSLAAFTAKYYLSIILFEWDKDSTAAKTLLYECLKHFKAIGSEKHIEKALHQLGAIELDDGNLDQAESYFAQNLEIDRKLDDKRGIAFTLHMLGWLEDHRGRFSKALELYDQALTYWLRIYREGDPEAVAEAIHSIAGEYQHKGLVHEHLGNVEEVESNYLRALEWHRKSDFKPDIGKILYLLARLKYREAQYDSGNVFLDEAIELYTRIGDHGWRGRCLDMKSRVHFTLGKTREAAEFFEAALKAVQDAGDHKEEEAYLNKLGRVYLEGGKPDQAKDYFERARDSSLRNELLEGYATSVKNLAEIAQLKGDVAERNRLISEGIQALEKYLHSVQAEPRRAFILGQIGFFYEGMEDFQESLNYYQKARKAFEALSDIGGVANCLGSIARIKGLSGNTNEEFETYLDLKKRLVGTPYYDLIAGTDINLGVLQMRMGNLEEAKILFQDAELLCSKYNLTHMVTLQENLKRLKAKIKAKAAPQLTLTELVEELFQWVEWFPEAKDSILRLWMEGRAEVLFSNFRHLSGVKLMICQDDVDEFLRISDILCSFSDLCLQIVDAEFPDAAIDFIPFPMDKKLFFDCAIPFKEKVGGIDTIGFKSGSIKSRYTLTSDRAQSKVTGNEGIVVTGWSPGLPRQAHQLILSSSASELLRRRIFFLPADRCRVDDKVLADLDHSHELGLIPVYFGSLPESEKVSVVTFASVPLPIVNEGIVVEHAKPVRAIKRRLAQLRASPKSTAQTVLDDLIFEVEELKDVTKSKTTLHTDIYVVEFPSRLDKDTQVVFVIQDHGMDDLTRNSPRDQL